MGYTRLFSTAVFCVVLAGFAQAQSLGDVARKEKAKKAAEAHTSTVITNENINEHIDKSSDQTINFMKPKSNAASDATDREKDDVTAGAKDAKNKDEKAGDEAEKPDADLSAKIGDQKSKIDLLQREIDVAQREQRLRASTYYADPGSRLRDPQQFNLEQQKLTDGIAAKKKELDAATADLNKMKEEARKQGLKVTE